ncbi:MAG: NusG domain II-containing protein [Oscillospiraceae bacterium]
MRAAQRKRVAWGDLLVALVILALAAALAVFLFPRSEQALTVRVVQDGELLLSCRLDDLDEPVLVPVKGPYPLTLELSREGVRVTETACPGEDCLHMGTISRAGSQIICLPNRLIVALEGEDSPYDAMTG